MAQLNVYVGDVLKAEIERIAIIEDRSVSYIIREWIEQALKHRQESQAESTTPTPSTSTTPPKTMSTQ